MRPGAAAGEAGPDGVAGPSDGRGPSNRMGMRRAAEIIRPGWNLSGAHARAGAALWIDPVRAPRRLCCWFGLARIHRAICPTGMAVGPG